MPLNRGYTWVLDEDNLKILIRNTCDGIHATEIQHLMVKQICSCLPLECVGKGLNGLLPYILIL